MYKSWGLVRLLKRRMSATLASDRFDHLITEKFNGFKVDRHFNRLLYKRIN